MLHDLGTGREEIGALVSALHTPDAVNRARPRGLFGAFGETMIGCPPGVAPHTRG